jgi:hypothetical protein
MCRTGNYFLFNVVFYQISRTKIYLNHYNTKYNETISAYFIVFILVF